MSILAHVREFPINAPCGRREKRGTLLLLLALAWLISASMEVICATLTPYPLTTCIVTGDKLDKDAVVFTYDGREIKTCCTNCIEEFYKDPAGFSAKLDEAAAQGAKK